MDSIAEKVGQSGHPHGHHLSAMLSCAGLWDLRAHGTFVCKG